MAEKIEFAHLMQKINNPTVMADDIICYKQYKKELDEISRILLTPTILEKCDNKYKKECPKDFFMADFYQRNPISDLLMKAAQLTCFKKSYYRPKINEQGYYNVVDKHGNILYDCALYGPSYAQLRPMSYDIAMQDAFKVINITKPFTKEQSVQHAIRQYQFHSFFYEPFDEKKRQNDYTPLVKRFLKCRGLMYKIFLCWFHDEPEKNYKKYITEMKKEMKITQKVPTTVPQQRIKNWIKINMQQAKETSEKDAELMFLIVKQTYLLISMIESKAQCKAFDYLLSNKRVMREPTMVADFAKYLKIYG